ncbi:hypothetical protein PILCRDRAFT_721801 [Piloderma croceum F 1598]|uniref:Uncharacterized protein n=1 Tax=Piloderma croceum (strain F 1598) TaxID=765440 RepID=A0A0C3AIS3_PILCF|nr:hypothetical protein PILCRDRAFT_721801 [Piloderma croceum F 1598]
MTRLNNNTFSDTAAAKQTTVLYCYSQVAHMHLSVGMSTMAYIGASQIRKTATQDAGTVADQAVIMRQQGLVRGRILVLNQWRQSSGKSRR